MFVLAGVLCLVDALAAVSLRADAVQDRRVQAGLRFFKAMIAADLDLEARLDDGKLLVVFLYVDDPATARDLAARFQADAQGGKIRDLPVSVVVADAAAYAALAPRKPAAVFLADPPGEQALAGLIAGAISRGMILYSPFEGHVERGVTGGIAVEAQVRPYINRATLEASKIHLKSFFLKVTKVYE